MSQTAGATVTSQIAPSQLYDLVKAGVEAFQRKDYKKRANCSKKNQHAVQSQKKKTKRSVRAWAMSFRSTWEASPRAQEAWAQAMTEYDKIQQPGFSARSNPTGTKRLRKR